MTGTTSRPVRPAPDRAADGTGREALAALGLLARSRADLDRAELVLITAAREQGGSWREVAEALGLGSRQAAEQRWRRLGQTVRGCQQFVDAEPIDIVTLRREAVLLRSALVLRLAGEGATEPLEGPERGLVGLAVRTLADAGQLPAGVLYDLARAVVGDLSAVPLEVLGAPVAEALARLSAATRWRPSGEP